MKYNIFKLSFPFGVHFGEGRLESSSMNICADTLFSALCIEALKCGDGTFDKLKNLVLEDKLKFSDALPYCDGECYIPKPMKYVEHDNEDDDPTLRKTLKAMTYIPASKLSEYLNGTYTGEGNGISELGTNYIQTCAALYGNEEAMPYRIGGFRFNKGNGLYIIVEGESEDILYFAKELLTSLSYSGIGGKRSSGFGRFELSELEENEVEHITSRLKKEGEVYISLSISLPKKDEMEEAVANAFGYNLVKKSGFVYSLSYSDEFLRKKDAYLFAAGSCFSKKFRGEILDVSTDGGSHVVYRYAKPIFMEVSI